MRIDVVVDDKLMCRAVRSSGFSTKRATIEYRKDSLVRVDEPIAVSAMELQF